MRPNNLLLLITATLMPCTAGATNYLHEIGPDAASNDAAFISERVPRNLHHDRRLESDSGAAAGYLEERGLLANFKALFKGHTNGATKLKFRKTSTIDMGLKANPDLSKAIANPEVNKGVKKLTQDKEFVHNVQKSPGFSKVTKTLQGNTAPLTKKNIEAIGAATVKSSGMNLGYGEGMVLAAGVLIVIIVILGIASGS